MKKVTEGFMGAKSIKISMGPMGQISQVSTSDDHNFLEKDPFGTIPKPKCTHFSGLFNGFGTWF